MDLLLKDLNPEQTEAFQRMASLLNITVKIRPQQNVKEDTALMTAMQETASEGILSADEKMDFLNQLRQK